MSSSKQKLHWTFRYLPIWTLKSFRIIQTTYWLFKYWALGVPWNVAIKLWKDQVKMWLSLGSK